MVLRSASVIQCVYILAMNAGTPALMAPGVSVVGMITSLSAASVALCNSGNAAGAALATTQVGRWAGLDFFVHNLLFGAGRSTKGNSDALES